MEALEEVLSALTKGCPEITRADCALVAGVVVDTHIPPTQDSLFVSTHIGWLKDNLGASGGTGTMVKVNDVFCIPRDSIFGGELWAEETKLHNYLPRQFLV